MAEFNPFGLTDSATLSERRNERRREANAQRRATVSGGLNKAGSETGAAIGLALGQAFQRKGWIQDMEQDRALAVDKATLDAQDAYEAIPEAERKKDAFGTGIQRRRALITELENAGLTNEADKVRTQVLDLTSQQAKMRKLNAESDRIDAQTAAEQLESQAVKDGRREKDELTRLQNTYSKLDLSTRDGAMRADQIQERINKLTTITGTTPDDPTAQEADKVTARKTEASLIDTQATLDGFNRSALNFNSKFLTLEGRVSNTVRKYVDIFNDKLLSKEQKEELVEYTEFKQSTSQNLNAYIKAITGAQMSNPEAVRLKKDVPTMDDSPTAYKAKMDKTRQNLAAVADRAREALVHVDNRQKFLGIMNTDLTNWIAPLPEDVEEAERAVSGGQADPNEPILSADEFLREFGEI